MDARRAAAMRALEPGMPATAAERAALGDRLSRLGVEADLAQDHKSFDAGAIARTKLANQTAKHGCRQGQADGRDRGEDARSGGAHARSDGKRKIGEDYASKNAEVPGITDAVRPPREAAARWGIAAGARGALAEALH